MRSLCLIALSLTMLGAVQAQKASELDESTLSAKYPSLLYIWSERMVYSVQQKEQVKQLAQALGLEFIPIHEQQAAANERLKALEALRHFPTAFVIAHGRIHPQPIVGAMPLPAWQLSIEQRLSSP